MSRAPEEGSPDLRTVLREAEALLDARDADLRAAVPGLRAALEQTRAARARGRINATLWRIERALGLHEACHSQSGQDAFLDRHVFRGRRGGVFAEIGGYDGLSGSNCLFFEVMRGWSGVLVEPSPRRHAAAASFRRVPCVDCAVAATEGEAAFLDVAEGYAQMSGLVDTYDPKLRRQVEDDPRFRGGEITVRTRPLADILSEQGLSEIDYISLDVEGGERTILESFPFADFRIHAWTVENNTADPAIPALMRDRGFGLVEALGVDEVYLRQA